TAGCVPTGAAPLWSVAEGEAVALAALPDRRVPPAYLRAPEPVRRALLAGLLDAAGTVTPLGSVRIELASAQPAADVDELVVGLGYQRAADTPATSVDFDATDEVFRVERCRLLHKERRATGSADADRRFVVDVRPVTSVPVKCVTVDNADHLYLAGPA